MVSYHISNFDSKGSIFKKASLDTIRLFKFIHLHWSALSINDIYDYSNTIVKPVFFKSHLICGLQ